jgi:hypothetical protein
MSKLKFQIALPIAQLLLALALLALARREPQTARIDFPYSPTALLICNGINAPAALFSIGASLLPIENPDRTPISVLGFGVREGFFLLGVTFLWFFIGRAIDHRPGRGKARIRPARGIKSLLDIVLMLLGVLILMVGIMPILDPQRLTNPTGATAAAVLWLAWFLVLFFLPGMDLVREFLRRPSSGADAL